jgi:hypothetical protein
MSTMTKAAKRTIILCIAVLHLALVLPFSAGSVTCIDGDGLTKIENNCEQACGCEDQTTVPIDHQAHESDGCGDCTHFLLSTLLQVTSGVKQLGSDGWLDGDMAAVHVLNEPGFSDLKLQGRSRFDKNRPLLVQRISSLETTVIIC